jgi:uncharacterized Fe-S center protein
MSDVLFRPITSDTPVNEVSRIARELLSDLVISENLTLHPEIVLKVHFGEKGNVTYLSQDYFAGMIDYLEERSCKPSYIETNVLYRGERTTRERHLKLALEHGFNRLPIIIADGEHGEEYSEVHIHGKHFSRCKIAKGVADAPQMLVLSHFKGHYFSGFGGALKQLAMGCAARGGKLDQHAGQTPHINFFTCKRCGLCAAKCPVGAIRIGLFPRIDSKSCVGCAACISHCPRGAVQANMLRSLSGSFFERLAEYAYAAGKDKPNLYVSIAANITRGCDCMGLKMKPIAPDLGVFASTDPVALDTACLDLLARHTGRSLFKRGRRTLAHAEKMGLGSREYTLREV